jgi:hypothetical protein
VIDDAQRLAASGATAAGAQSVCERLQQAAHDLNIPVIAFWPDLAERGEAPEAWCERFFGADAVMVLTHDSREAPGYEAGLPVTLHVVKNRRGEKGRLKFTFIPAFAKFLER